MLSTAASSDTLDQSCAPSYIKLSAVIQRHLRFMDIPSAIHIYSFTPVHFHSCTPAHLHQHQRFQRQPFPVNFVVTWSPSSLNLFVINSVNRSACTSFCILSPSTLKLFHILLNVQFPRCHHDYHNK